MRARVPQAHGFALAAILAEERDLSWANAHVDHALLERALAQVAQVRGAEDKRSALAALIAAVQGREPAPQAPREGAPHRAPPALGRRRSGELDALLGRLARASGSGP
jgi:hypothetical protein